MRIRLLIALAAGLTLLLVLAAMGLWLITARVEGASPASRQEGARMQRP